MSAYATLDEVVAALAALEQRFRSRGDRRAVFATLYGVVSAEMRDRVARRSFGDNEWVHRYAVTFANYYREALEAYDAGRVGDVAKAWRLCFDAAAVRTGLVLQDLLLGVNAHVNSDLPLALQRVSIDPDRSSRRRDHDAVNDVLAAVTERATQRIAALYAPGLRSLDDCAGELDEMLSRFSLQTARDSAWESAIALTNARSSQERELTATFVSTRAAVMARVLLAPSRHAPLMAACRRLEEGPEWLTVVAQTIAAASRVSPYSSRS